MLWFLPIEPLEERYTEQMLRWVVEALDARGTCFRVIGPGQLTTQSIREGQFLDVFGTIGWKSWQVQYVAAAFQDGKVEPGDVFLVGDLWFPGVTAIKYMAELAGIPVKVYGWHYAGCSDPNDFVQRLGPWAKWAELGMLKSADGIFLGSRYHAYMLKEYYYPYELPVHVIGLPWNLQDVKDVLGEYPKPLLERPMKVIFPHRGAPEKDPGAFYRLATTLSSRVAGYEFVITSSRQGSPEELGFRTGEYWTVKTGLSKREYYQELATSRVMFSAAKQETFGYCLQEAIAFGTIPVVPNRCSYVEVLENDTRFLYDSEQGGMGLVAHYLERPFEVVVPPRYTEKYDGSVEKALEIALSESVPV